MSKGLEALHNISLFQFEQKDKPPFYIKLSECFKEDFDIIEKELKALEIIKDKEMLSVFQDTSGKYFIVFNGTGIEIPKEEYDLLKEVLL